MRNAWLKLGGLVIGVALTVTGCGWDQTVTSVDDLEQPASPTAAIEVSASRGTVPFEVTFDASGSTTPEGTDIEDYEWAFGDNQRASGVEVTHIYTSTGRFTARLTVTNDRGGTDTESVEITVRPNEGPQAAFSVSPRDPLTNQSITFDASGSADAAGLRAQTIVDYQWDFGDGAQSTGRVVTHRYGDDGEYDVKLTLTDHSNATTSLAKTITVANRAPTASIAANPDSGSAPLTVDFSGADSSDADGNIQTYAWDFGDTSGASGRTASHTFETSGTYTVRLVVTDDDGATDRTSMTIDAGSNGDNSADPAHYDGVGDDTISIEPPSDGPFLLEVSGNDEGQYFVVTGYDTEGNVTSNFIATTDPFDGVTVDPSGDTAELEIMAPGAWSVDVRPLETAETLSVPGRISGSGPDVFRVEGTPTTARIQGNDDGKYFNIKGFSSAGDWTALLVDSTDPYDGQVSVPEETSIIDVDAVGDWTVEIE